MISLPRILLSLDLGPDILFSQLSVRISGSPQGVEILEQQDAVALDPGSRQADKEIGLLRRSEHKGPEWWRSTRPPSRLPLPGRHT